MRQGLDPSAAKQYLEVERTRDSKFPKKRGRFYFYIEKVPQNVLHRLALWIFSVSITFREIADSVFN